MKYLNDYVEQAQTDLFKKCGSFFAFSGKQYNEAKKDIRKSIIRYLKNKGIEIEED